MRHIWDIAGGVHPPENKSQSNSETIAHSPLPDELILPLNQHIGTPAIPIVTLGQKVKKGELIADAVGVFSAGIHAPTSGTIIAIEDRLIAHPSGMSAPCIVIEADQKDEWIPLEPCEHFENLSADVLRQKVHQAGLAGMGGAGFPTSVKLKPDPANTIDALILNGTECEPYITADDRLMREKADEIVLGMSLLALILGNPHRKIIGIEDNKPEAIEQMRKAAKGTDIEVVSFPTKYPSGGEKQLIQILTGKEVPSGKLPADIGMVVQNVGTAYAAWRAVRYGEPLIERVTTLAGKTLKSERNVWARIGTPIDHLLKTQGFTSSKAQRVIMGGPMMGFAIPDLNVPIVKTSNCILAPSPSELPPAEPAQACIRCGMCSEACPAQLLPQQLYWYARSEDQEKLLAHNLFDCIECGACSYVCPSAIPLVQYYRAAKGSIRQHESEKLKSDKARERFEQRKTRIAKEEAAKEAKRAARKKAAEAAKQKLAEQAEEKLKTSPSANVDTLVAEAQADAKKGALENTEDVAAERKKLERSKLSTDNRIKRIEQQLAETEDAARRGKLEAQMQQAKLKQQELAKKLSQKVVP